MSVSQSARVRGSGVIVDRVSHLCDSIVEASWLVALVVVPLYFDVYSSRIFEPDKIAILRSLALLIVAAWIAKAVSAASQGQLRFDLADLAEKTKRLPFLIPTACLAVVYLIATAFSLNPNTSWWGSYQRMQGAYTTLSYLVFFAAVATGLRHRAQAERLVSLVIVASLPVSIYGIVQRYGMDPIPWAGDVVDRVAGNMGNAIFLAAYLIMALPLTAIRTAASFRAILSEREPLPGNLARASGYVIVLALQITTLYLTGSRGPWLGALVGMVFLAVALSVYWRKRALTLAILGSGVLVGLFLVVLNLPNGPLERLRHDTPVARMAQLFAAESDTGRVRVLIWQGASRLVLPHEPLTFPNGDEDAFAAIRPLVGYGPETMFVAFNRFYPPELGRLERRDAVPDRSHNETWDSLVTTGVLGLVVNLAVYTSVFYFGLRWLGLIATKWQRSAYWTLVVVGGTAGALSLSLWRGFEFFGVGLPSGIVAGLVAYVILGALGQRADADRQRRDPVEALIVVGLMAAAVGHFVEISFGIAIAVTRLYFWVYVGLMAAIGLGLRSDPREDAGDSRSPTLPARSKTKRRGARSGASSSNRRRESIFQGAWLSGMTISLLIAVIGLDFIANPARDRSPAIVLISALVQAVGDDQRLSIAGLTLVGITWAVASAILAGEDLIRGGAAAVLRRLLAVLAIAFSTSLAVWMIQAAFVASLAGRQTGTADDILSLAAGYESLPSLTYTCLLVYVGVFAIVLHRQAHPRRSTSSTWGKVAAPAAFVAAAVIALATNLSAIQANVAFKVADAFSKPGSWPAAIVVLKRVTELAPREPYYLDFLARAVAEEAKASQDASRREQLFGQAVGIVREAQREDPLNTDHTSNVARLYSQWASATGEPALVKDRIAAADKQFALATTLSPMNAKLWDEWSLLHSGQMDDFPGAETRLAHSWEIDSSYDLTAGLLGQLYFQRSQTITDKDRRAEYLARAADYYSLAMSLPDTVGQAERDRYRAALGAIHGQLGSQ